MMSLYALRRSCAGLFLCSVLLAPVPLGAQPSSALQRGPLQFIENRGQIVDANGHPRKDIRYAAYSQGLRVYLRDDGVSYVFHSLAGLPSEATRDRSPYRTRFDDSLVTVTSFRMDMQLEGAKALPTLTSDDTTGTVYNFYLAQCPDGITGARGFRRIVYHDVYPSIDLVYYTGSGGLKYDFIVRPGGRASDIRMRYRGYDRIDLTADGRALVHNPYGQVEEGRPVAYQVGGFFTAAPFEGGNGHVDVSYRSAGGVITFDVGRYDTTRPLVIDPTLVWSTYLGGSGIERGWTEEIDYHANLRGGIAYDGDTSFTLAGSTMSLDFPTTPGVAQTTRVRLDALFDSFVACFGRSGKRLWATYLGGSRDDEITGLASLANGGVALAGFTWSPDIPVTSSAFETSIQNDTWSSFVARLDAWGRLDWCSYYNGVGANAIAVDTADNLIVGGNAVTPRPGTAFVTRFAASGARQWSVYFGGTIAENGDAVNAIALDSRSNIYVCGSAASRDFRTSDDAFQQNLRGTQDAFIVKFDKYGNTLWATLFGGNNRDFATGLEVDHQGTVVVTGCTQSADLPGSGRGAQTFLAGGWDAFVTRFDRQGRNLGASYFGGAGDDYVFDIGVDGRNRVWLGGTTGSSDLRASNNAIQRTLKGESDGMLVRFEADGEIGWASYLGGHSGDDITGIAVNPLGCMITGSTRSADFPTTTASYQSQSAGAADAFVAAICDPSPSVGLSSGLRLCGGDSLVLSAPLGFDYYRWSSGEGSRTITVTRPGRYWFSVGIGGCEGVSDTVVVTPAASIDRRVTTSSASICDGDSVRLRAAPGMAAYRWSTGETTAAIWARASGAYSVYLVDSSGCSTASDTVHITAYPKPSAAIVSDQPLTFCDGDSAVLRSAVHGVDYQWSTGERTESIVVRRGGTYRLTLTDTNGCSASASVVVAVYPAPQPAVEPRNAEVCAGDSVRLRCSSFARYEWSTGDTTQSIVVTKPGVYVVKVWNDNGCVGTSDTVTVDALTQPDVTLAGSPQSCEGQLAMYSVPDVPNARYRWEVQGGVVVSGIDGSTVTVEWRSRGRGLVRATVTMGSCFGTSEKFVDVYPGLEPDVVASGPVAFCDGDSVVLRAPLGYLAYRWSNGGLADTLVVYRPGEYSVLVDNGVCTGVSDAVTVVVHPRPPKPEIEQSGQLLITDAGDGARWSLDGMGVASPMGDTLSAIKPGIYRVVATNWAGCSTESDPFVVRSVEIRRFAASIDTVSAQVGDRFRVTLAINPPLRASDSVVWVRAVLRMNSKALFVHGIHPGDGSTDTIEHDAGSGDAVVITRRASSGTIAGSEILWLDLEGLASGEPVNQVRIESLQLSGASTIASLSHGVVLLSGCEVGASFAQRVRLFGIDPNPASAGARLHYRAPHGVETVLRLIDATGREVRTMRLPPGTGAAESVLLSLTDIPSGMYMLELHDRTERSLLPVVVAK